MRGKTGWLVASFGSLIGLWLVLSVSVTAAANSLSLVWDANTEEDLAGYKLYIGMSSRGYTRTIDVGHVTTYTVTDLESGETYYFALTAYDIFASESDYSNEVSATIAAVPQTTPPATAEPEPTPPATAEPEPTPTTQSPEPAPTIEPLPTKEPEPAPAETTQSAPQTTKSEPPPPAPAPTAPSTKEDLSK